jgi:mannose-1-phosphate guanylyltransferase/mannose-6-phosphate isomerase
VFPVVISGGAGTRLWPLSTPFNPKQFHALHSHLTLIQETVLRTAHAQELAVSAPVVICNHDHLNAVQAQMAAIDCIPSAIVLEPFGRNTAPVAMTAALICAALDPKALVLLMPSDHVIARPDAFNAALAAAAPLARERIVLLGVKPTTPETGYGYIEVGQPLDGAVSTVARFEEKPDVATGQRYLDSGRYLWNAGIFLFAPHVLIAEMERLAPAVASATRAAVERSPMQQGVIDLDAEAFAPCPSISLDYAVMEHTDKAAVTPLDADWADIGSWSSLWSQGPRGPGGNFVHGDAQLLDTEDCLIWSEGKTVATIGLRDLIVVQTDQAVLVLPKSRAQDVKLIVEQLKARAARAGGAS